MRLTKVYTKTGDKGTTGLADGSRINKDHIRIESYGNIDELNSVLGICRQVMNELPTEAKILLDRWLFALQNDLFNIGSDLATPISARWDKMILISQIEVNLLENLIDYCQANLAPLREFVLPGGTLLNSYLHLARTVCRRAERAIVTLAQAEDINNFIIPYINRLSDFIFVLSRWVQYKCNIPEVTWNKEEGLRAV